MTGRAYVAPEDAERNYWNAHATPIDVWGEYGYDAWVWSAISDVKRIEQECRLRDLRVGSRVLDLGCGLGRLAVPIAAKYQGLNVRGYDISEAMVVAAQSTAILYEANNAYFNFIDGRAIPWNGVSFSAAWSVLLFQHIPPDAQRGYVEQVGDYLTPGGRFLVQIDASEATDGGFLNWRTSPADLTAQAAEAGLRAVSEETDDRYPTWRWMTFEKESR